MTTLLFLLFTFAIFEPADFSDRFLAPSQTGLIEVNELAEASGMVASIKNKGNFWVINDSGNAPKIFLINKTGKIVRSYWIKKAHNVDWEDIAIRIDPESGKPQIAVADIGDNSARRNNISIIMFDEPDINETQVDEITSYDTYHLQYEDGARDAETLLIDPLKDVFYIISKREEQVRIYESPIIQNPTDKMTLIFRDTLPLQFITSGGISMDGSEIVLKNYNSIFYWQRSGNQSLCEVLKGKHELLNYVPEPQGESICWSLDNSGFFTLSEKSWAKDQVLYFYERKKVK